jgi:hypothetical protein
MLRKTMIVLATAAALTGGLTADAFARGGGGAGVDTVVGSVVALIWAAGSAISAVLAGLSAAALRVSTLPQRAATSAAIGISVAAGVSRRVGECRTDTMATTMATAAIMIRRLSRPASSPPIRPRITLRPLSLRRRPHPTPTSYLTRTRECRAKNPTCCALASY